jgi:hypothetical protein
MSNESALMILRTVALPMAKGPKVSVKIAPKLSDQGSDS